MLNMVLNILKVLIVYPVIFSTLNLNHANAKTKSDIFSITGENVLWRKMEFASNDNRTISNSSNKNQTRLMNYLSLISYEMNELDDITEQNLKEDFISLPAAYVEISSDEIKFHSMIYDDLSTFKKIPVKLETIIPDGSDPNTIKIVYESKIKEIIVTGSAEINGTDYDFILNITEVIFKSEHERALTRAGGTIVTKSINETFDFKKFRIIIKLPQQNKTIESPNKKILRRLADPWMVTLVNALDKRFVQYRIRDQSQSYFDKHKNTLLEYICSSVLALSDESTDFRFAANRPLKLLGKTVFDQYEFESISYSNFSNFVNCTSKAISVKLVANSPDENFYSHSLLLIFTDNSATKRSLLPFLKWTLKKITFNTVYEEYLQPTHWETSKECYSLVMKYWSAVITILTDKQGRKTSETKVSIDIRPESYGEVEPHYWTNQFLDLFTKSMADDLQFLIDTTML